MMNASLPHWSNAGVLPPVRPNSPGHSAERSPYTVSLSVFVERFSSSPERIKILQGFLQFRARLHEVGLVSGFQWLDGSFMEHVELLESRPPNDIDVVTFFELPAGETQTSLMQRDTGLFTQELLKNIYFVDGYFAQLGQPTDRLQVKNIAYWYSMWSHRRNGVWKGFVQVDLDPTEDAEALALLAIHGGGS